MIIHKTSSTCTVFIMKALISSNQSNLTGKMSTAEVAVSMEDTFKSFTECLTPHIGLSVKCHAFPIHIDMQTEILSILVKHLMITKAIIVLTGGCESKTIMNVFFFLS